ncbi:DUF1016 N-terminal domain-containing protein [Candidatus Omnitrophota bacterium]
MQKDVAKQKYNNLVKEIGELFEKAKKALAECYWEIGKRIVQVEQSESDRAEYGTNLLIRLSKDLTKKHGEGFSVRNLERMRKFFLTYPKSTAPSKLSWTHYAELLNLKEPDMRARYEAIAERNKLSHRALRQLIKEENALHRGKHPTAAAQRRLDLGIDLQVSLKTSAILREGRLGTVKLIEPVRMAHPRGHVIVDCGFHVLRTIPKSEAPNTVEKPHYLYYARLDRIIDGDTLALIIDCGGGVFICENIRLRGINALEIETPRGKAAKLFVERELTDVIWVLIKTYSSDIYGRYVADLLYLPRETNPLRIQKEGKYLNQQLLDAGHAYIL